MDRRNILIWSCILAVVLSILVSAGCLAQQAPATAETPLAPASPAADIWRMVPSDSVLVAAYDVRPENPSVQVFTKGLDTQARERQTQALKKSIEDFSTLFGISLDFARDIDPWLGNQWAVAVLPSTKTKGVGDPVVIIASKDAAAANAALEKLLAPWQRIGELSAATTAGCTVRAFKAKKGEVEIYASACGQSVVIAPSETALKSALGAQGFAAGTPAERVLSSLAGSVLYVYVNPAIMDTIKAKQTRIQVPLNGFGAGLSAIDTGIKLRVIGQPNEQVLPLLQQFLTAAPGTTSIANDAIPKTSLVVATVPNLSSALSMLSTFGGGKDPRLNLLSIVGDTQMSGAVTAVLPAPSGVVTASAESEAAASQKAERIHSSLKQSNMKEIQVADIAGVKVSSVSVSKDFTVLWAQSGHYLLFATDQVALANSLATVNKTQPSITEDATYRETIAALGDANIQTTYVNLAPVRGIGYLGEGLGVGKLSPLYGYLAQLLQNVHSLGVGAGFNGEMVSVSIFLRTQPSLFAIGPLETVGIASMGAAIAFPIFARAREAARASECASNMKELAIAVHLYADDYNGKLPSRTNWIEELRHYVKTPIDELVTCTVNGEESRISFNKNLGGLNINKILNPSEVVMFFQGSPELPSASGSRADVFLPSGAKGNFAFVDAHVQTLSEAPQQNQWVPKYQGSKKAAPKPRPVIRR